MFTQEYLVEPEDNQEYSELRKEASVTLSNISLKCREDKINMVIEKGEIVSIVGSVGTGKVNTTALFL